MKGLIGTLANESLDKNSLGRKRLFETITRVEIGLQYDHVIGYKNDRIEFLQNIR